MSVTPGGRYGAAWDRTALVPDGQPDPLPGRDQPVTSALVQDLRRPAEHHRDDVGLAGQPADRPRADRGTSGGGAVVGTGGTYDSRFESSIVAGNEAPINADVASFLDSVITIDGSYNMIRSWSPRITLPFDTSNADPQLLPLADNGGFTKTHAIAECSPAIDAGLNGDSLDWDQRGEPYTRESGAGTDIGAFEYQFYFPDGYIFRDGFEAPRCP